jgi:AraC family transcriptional regulator, regulatory protein of adaptative response / DNA-3-methyladenine glycosylase II
METHSEVKGPDVTSCVISPSVCLQARLSRDARFDGQFFTGVFSTGIYCRSICPAPPPLEKNVRYFDSAIQAANAGLRPCLRCRPDSAPHSHAWLGTQTSLKRAIRLIEQGYLRGENSGSVASLAVKLGISSRYLTKLFQQGLGTSPKRFALYQQLMFAKQLLHQTQLPITQVAMAAGFNSLRRFNEVFQQELQLTPTALRKASAKTRKNTRHDKDIEGTLTQEICLSLAFRPPLNWQKMWAFYQFRQVSGMEILDEDQSYSRSFCFDGVKGVFRVRLNKTKSQFDAKIFLLNSQDINQLHQVVLRIRRLLDLDTDMATIAQAFTPLVNMGAKLDAGLRIPATAGVFEAACRAVLGQQVSVQQATKLLNTLVEHYGETFELNGQVWRLFPTPEAVAKASLAELKMPGARKLALNALGTYVQNNPLSTPDDWLDVKGIGPWTVAYAKMRGLSEPDVLLSSDLVIKHRIYGLYAKAGASIETPKAYIALATDIATKVSPWGSYLTFGLWDDEDLMTSKKASSKNVVSKKTLTMNNLARTRQTKRKRSNEAKKST